MRGALEAVSVKSLRDERPDLPGFVRPSRGLSPINGGVAQWKERRITNPWDAGSTPAPATNLIFLAAQRYERRAAATGGPAKDAPITPYRVTVV